MKNFLYIIVIAALVGILGFLTLQYEIQIGPIILALTLLPLVGLVFAKRSLKSALPDLIFGAIDTGLLTIPALWGGILFGVVGAIAGGVIGDAFNRRYRGIFRRRNSEMVKRQRSRNIA